MNNNRPLIILAFVVIAIVGGSLWILNKTPEVIVAATPTPARAPAPSPDVPPPSVVGTHSPKVEPTPVVASVPKATPRPIQPWEQKIDDVLRSPADEAATAQILINMLPTLPPDGQEEAAQHIANLVLDEQYSRVLPLVKNANLPEEVLDVFVTDLMNRDDATKLPALLEIAKIPNHPHHEEALTDLEIFLDEDFGSDWGKWKSAVDKYLKEQAAEESETPVAPAPKK